MNNYELISGYLDGTLGSRNVGALVVDCWRIGLLHEFNALNEKKSEWTDHHSNLASLLLDVIEFLETWLKQLSTLKHDDSPTTASAGVHAL